MILNKPNPSNIYDYPKLYDVLFSDTALTETNFLVALFNRFGKRVQNVFEPGCGTGRILYRLAKQGYRVTGLDLNPQSVRYCNRRLKRCGVAETAFVGNMTNFTLSDLPYRKKMDAAFNLVSTFLHLTDDRQAVSHFRCVADVLKTGGLYVLGFHLRPAGISVCSKEAWTAKKGTLFVRSSLKPIHTDYAGRIETIEFKITATAPKRQYSVADIFPLRFYSASQFDEVLKKAGCFAVEQTYSFEYNIDKPERVTPKTEDVVFVLRKN